MSKTKEEKAARRAGLEIQIIDAVLKAWEDGTLADPRERLSGALESGDRFINALIAATPQDKTLILSVAIGVRNKMGEIIADMVIKGKITNSMTSTPASAQS